MHLHIVIIVDIESNKFNLYDLLYLYNRKLLLTEQHLYDFIY